MIPLHLVQGHGFKALDFSVSGFATVFLEQSNHFGIPLDTSG